MLCKCWAGKCVVIPYWFRPCGGIMVSWSRSCCRVDWGATMRSLVNCCGCCGVCCCITCCTCWESFCAGNPRKSIGRAANCGNWAPGDGVCRRIWCWKWCATCWLRGLWDWKLCTRDGAEGFWFMANIWASTSSKLMNLLPVDNCATDECKGSLCVDSWTEFGAVPHSDISGTRAGRRDVSDAVRAALIFRAAVGCRLVFDRV